MEDTPTIMIAPNNEGLVDLRKVQAVNKLKVQESLQKPVYSLVFLMETGMQVQWTFDDEESQVECFDLIAQAMAKQ